MLVIDKFIPKIFNRLTYERIIGYNLLRFCNILLLHKNGGNMKKLFAFTIIIIYLSLGTTIYAQSLNINAKSAILIDGKTGQVIYEQNANQQLYPASTTKIMTALLALENGKLDQQMTSSRLAVNEIGINGSNIGIEPGEIFSLDNLLHALMIKSANDCANIIAENISPTRADFVNLMNKRALELGATNTNFTNTCGLDKSDGHPNHLTTVSDMSKFARHAMKIPKFRELVTTTSYTMPDTNKHPSTYWPKEYITTTNKFLIKNSPYKSQNFEITGIKTGYTNLAGCNLVTSAIDINGMELICVIFGAKDQDTLYKETRRLLEYGFEVFSNSIVANIGDLATTIDVNNAKSDEGPLDLVHESILSVPLPKDKAEWKLQTKFIPNQDISAPIHKGDLLGVMEYYRGDIKLATSNLVSSREVAAPKVNSIFPSTKEKSNHVKIIMNSIYIMVGLYALLFVTRKILRKISKSLKAKKTQNDE